MNIVMIILILTKLLIYTLQVMLTLEIELEILMSIIRSTWMRWEENMLDDGVFNISQNSNHDVDNNVESNGSQANFKDDDDDDG